MSVATEHMSLVRYLKKDCHEIRESLHYGKVDLLHAALGLAGEAGEVTEVIKKHVINGRELDREDLLNEVGDVLFYMGLLLNTLNFTLDDALQANIDKLSARYPQGYSDKAARERLDETG